MPFLEISSSLLRDLKGFSLTVYLGEGGRGTGRYTGFMGKCLSFVFYLIIYQNLLYSDFGSNSNERHNNV